MPKSLFLTMLLLIIPIVVQAEINVEELRIVLEENPEIIVNALSKYQQKQNERNNVQQNQAIQDYMEQSSNRTNEIFAGKDNSNIVLMEFFDFSCKYCKNLAPEIINIAEKYPDIKIVFKPLAFVANVSSYAQKASIAANEQGKFLELYGKIFAEKKELTEDNINIMAKEIGLNMAKFFADVKSEKTAQIAQEITTLSQNISVAGTPTLILNDKIVKHYPIENVIQEIEQIRSKKSDNPLSNTASDTVSNNNPMNITRDGVEIIKQYECSDSLGHKICGVLKNNTPFPKRATVEVIYYDEDDVKLEDEYDYVDIDPNGKAKFKTGTYFNSNEPFSTYKINLSAR